MKTLDVMSVAQAARRIGIRVSTLRRRINRGTVIVDTMIDKQVLTLSQVRALRLEEKAKKKS